MPEYCTCGAELPPDARFCHKCGKPQREEPNIAPEEPWPVRQEQRAALPVLPAAPPEIGFRNSLAVRVGLLVGSLAFLLLVISVPVYPLLGLLSLLGAGAYSVYLYGRRSGCSMGVRGGVKMGWITGLFCFVICTVLFTIILAALLRDGGLSALSREQLSATGMSQEMIQQATEFLRSPMQILGGLVNIFVISTFVPALGGALGAKLLGKH